MIEDQDLERRAKRLYESLAILLQGGKRLLERALWYELKTQRAAVEYPAAAVGGHKQQLPSSTSIVEPWRISGV